MTCIQELRDEGLIETSIEETAMPTTKDYRDLHDRVVERPGALDRLNALREETLMEIGLYARPGNQVPL